MRGKGSYVTDYGKLHRHVGWKPEIGVRRTLELLRSFWEENQEALARPLVPGAMLEFPAEFAGRVA